MGAKNECFDCKRHSPFCHNEETCEFWHQHMEKQRAKYNHTLNTAKADDDYAAARRVFRLKSIRNFNRRKKGKNK